MKLRLLIALGLAAATAAGCSAGIAWNAERAPVPGITADSRGASAPDAADMEHPSGKVTVWSHYEGAEWIIPVVQAEYPDVEIEVKTVPWNIYESRFLSAIDSGTPPDVLFADNVMLKSLTGLNAFENLSEAPYYGEELASRFTEATVSPYRSLEDRSLFGLPLDIGPAVAYYRHDVFEQAGLPSEPEKLSRYLEDPNHWLSAARTLKEQGSWIASSVWDPVWITEYGYGFFDSDLAYARETEAFASAIRLARVIGRDGLASNLNLYSDEGRASLNNGTTAMFYNGWWYRNELASAAPDTAGKWRMMRLPFGQYGWAGSSGVLIPSDANNKAGAWAVVRVLTDKIAKAGGKDVLEGDLNTEENPFYGGQQTSLLYAGLIRNMPSYTPTPLDAKALEIWSQFIYNSLENEIEPQELLARIRQLTVDSLQSELELLKE